MTLAAGRSKVAPLMWPIYLAVRTHRTLMLAGIEVCRSRSLRMMSLPGSSADRLGQHAGLNPEHHQ